MLTPELLRNIRHLEIRTRGLVNNVFGGEYHSAFRGRGIEFAEVRPYQIGDDVRQIDWNVSARTGDTYVKVFEEEREQTVMLAVDVSASEAFGSSTRFKREAAAEICAVLAFSAVQNNDKVGLLLFSDIVELFVPPKKGRKHVLRLIHDLFAFEPKSRGTDIDAALQHTMRVLKQRAVVIVLSDFLDEDFERSLRVASQKHDLVAIELFDRREEALPEAGLVRLQDAESGQEAVIDLNSADVRESLARSAHMRRERVDGIMARLAVDHVRIRADENYVDPLVRLFRRRNHSRA